MPFRFNNPRRHEFEKPKYRVRQSHDYERALQQRGNLTLWFTDTAIESWHPPQRADTSDCVRALQPVLAGPA